MVLDTFTDSSTTGIAANLLNRRFVGIDLEEDYLKLSKCRKIEIENPKVQKLFLKKLKAIELPEWGRTSNLAFESSKKGSKPA